MKTDIHMHWSPVPSSWHRACCKYNTLVLTFSFWSQFLTQNVQNCCNFLRDKNTRSILCSNICFLTLIPERHPKSLAISWMTTLYFVLVGWLSDRDWSSDGKTMIRKFNFQPQNFPTGTVGKNLQGTKIPYATDKLGYMRACTLQQDLRQPDT